MTQNALLAYDDDPGGGEHVVPIFDPAGFDFAVLDEYDMSAGNEHDEDMLAVDDAAYEEAEAYRHAADEEIRRGRHLHLVVSGDGKDPHERAEEMLAGRKYPFNDEQLEVIRHDQGPMLVLAGAGAGKTTTLISRVTYLVLHEKAAPSEILTITFTNKVAKELVRKLRDQAGIDSSTTVSAGTFHWLCGGILRTNAGRIGRSAGFKIVDPEALRAIIRTYMTANDRVLCEAGDAPRWVQEQISWCKSRMITPEQYVATDPSPQRKMVARLWEDAQHEMLRSDSMDFDDMLLLAIELLRENPDILEAYRRRWKYIQVDEYQDTNKPQFELIKLLAGEKGNLVAVGDDRQAIYSFRASDVRNIRAFMEDYEGAKMAHLSTNYRSSPQIVESANTLISNARDLLSNVPMRPAPHSPDGPAIKGRYCRADLGGNTGDANEVDWVATQVAAQVEKGKSMPCLTCEGRKCDEHGEMCPTCHGTGWRKLPCEIAVLARGKRPLEALAKKLGTKGVAHRLMSGHGFYKRPEIKQVIAHLALIVNPKDETAFAHAVTTRYGVNDISAGKVIAYAQAKECGYLEVGKYIHEMTGINRPTREAIILFCEQMLELRQKALQGRSLTRLIRDIVYLPGGMIEQVKAKGEKAAREAKLEGEERAEQELDTLTDIIHVARHYEEDEENPSLVEFLSRVALNSEDGQEEVDNTHRVVLCTIHSAKGLEWDTVIIMAVEEGDLPNWRSETPEEFEEDRRLMYVALTRARRVAYVTCAANRLMKGRARDREPSRYIGEAGIALT